MCVGVCVCAHLCAFKAGKARAEQKNAISRIICMTCQQYEILKKLSMKSPSLPASALLRGKGMREWRFCFHGCKAGKVCFQRRKDREVRPPSSSSPRASRRPASAWTSPTSAYCRPAGLQPPVLMHYRSSPAQANTLFSSCG